jgi:putative spermidine/putrescine transport system permease protein
MRAPLAGRLALAPALVVLGLLVAVGLGYAVAQSLGMLPLAGEPDVGLDSYRALATGAGGAVDVWASAAFTLWVSAASTLLALALALAAAGWIDRPAGRRRRGATGVLHINLAIPHVVWAIGLLIILSQGGLLSRVAAAIGLISQPSEFPLLVRDPLGIGIILHYATKEAPFLALIAYALIRARPRELDATARSLGATGLRRFRMLTLPTVLPGLAIAGALVIAFVFGAYEAPVVLGMDAPRMLSVVGLDLFSASDLTLRPQAMALGVMMATAVMVTLLAALAVARRWR